MIDHWDNRPQDIITELFEDGDALILAHSQKPFDIIIKSPREIEAHMRKCWNWQTGKTKDLVFVLTCGFKSHLPH
mgnify:CR=1 FL=1